MCVSEFSEWEKKEEESERTDKTYLIALSIRLSELWTRNREKRRKKKEKSDQVTWNTSIYNVWNRDSHLESFIHPHVELRFNSNSTFTHFRWLVPTPLILRSKKIPILIFWLNIFCNDPLHVAKVRNRCRYFSSTKLYFGILVISNISWPCWWRWCSSERTGVADRSRGNVWRWSSRTTCSYMYCWTVFSSIELH